MRSTTAPAASTSYTRLASLAFLAIFSGPLPAHAANFDVDDLGEASDATPGNGVCATAGAVCTLRAAMEESDALGGANVIGVPAGTYVTNAQLPDVATDMTIAGAGSAQTVIQAGAGQPQLFNVISTGSLHLTHLQLANAHRAVGSTDGPVTIDNCLVAGNSLAPAIDVGGSGGTTVTYTIADTTIAANTANFAPALQVLFGNLVATNVTFLNNTSVGGGAGAVYLHGAAAFTHHFQNCTFTGNSGGDGGAILTDGGPITIDASTFSNNTASSGLAGGAIDSNATLLTITDTTFDQNHATNAGGGIGGGLFITGQARARRVTFSGNTATGQGGAMFVGNNVGAQFDCIDCTLSGNSATDGGGAVATGPGSGIVTLASSTVTANSATNAARGGALFAGQVDTIRLKNTIVAGNTDPGAPDCGGAGVQSSGYNLFGNSTGCSITPAAGDQIGTGANPIDPGLAPLADNGGGTQTHALLPTSPAGEAGNPVGCSDFTSAAIVTDQRQQPREVDGDNDGTQRCDIGAYEAAAGTFPTPTTTTTVPGATTSTTVGGSTTTSTTLQPPVCANGTTISNAQLTVKKLGGTAGDEVLTMKGTLDFGAAFPDNLRPQTKGAQLLIHDIGSGNAVVFNLTHHSFPIPPGPPGTGCNAKDGWKKLGYKNVSNALDPPACTPGSADGLKTLRFKDKRAKGKGIAFAAKASKANIPTFVGPARMTVVLGGTVVESLAGECGVHTFEAGSCKLKKSTLTCK